MLLDLFEVARMVCITRITTFWRVYGAQTCIKQIYAKSMQNHRGSIATLAVQAPLFCIYLCVSPAGVGICKLG